MHPVLFHVGSWTVYSYTAAGMLAIIAAITVAYLRLKPKGYTLTSVLVLAFAGSAAGLLGARLFYVAGHLDAFSHNPGEILTLQMSGLVFYGAVIVGGGAIILAARLLKIKVWEVADAVGLVLPLGLAIGRAGCFLNGCCGGKPSGLPWAVTFPGTVQSVHPTQLYELIMSLTAFVFLVYLSRRLKRDGELFFLALAACGTIRFFMEFLRVHENPLAASTFQILSVAIILLSTFFLTSGKKLLPVRGIKKESEQLDNGAIGPGGLPGMSNGNGSKDLTRGSASDPVIDLRPGSLATRK
ncbi:MAG: prolipoprotein diacylglyceryl transferase [Actinobacteria bacterium]|jgi:phosphatidylglycerol:prolipoprotein diacylglycerol transferase|nr:MAG: prolipoprotein diacylglyceryl transferase [Actinomycetota bacterium]